MVDSFLRPSEWKLLQNKRIRIFSDGGIEQLVISVPTPRPKMPRVASTAQPPRLQQTYTVRRFFPVMMGRTTTSSSTIFKTGPMRVTKCPRCSSFWFKEQDLRPMLKGSHTPPAFSGIPRFVSTYLRLVETIYSVWRKMLGPAF